MPREKVERPADPAVRRANLRRIARLFRPYSRKLSVVTVLIVVASGLGVVSPFLLRAVLDSAIVVPPDHAPIVRLGLLSELVGGMIAISLVTGVFGVVQSYLSTQVGQSVMHDLRTAVYRHLQRLSLAFFTKTRTGEVQSRIANDIGGVDNVLTSTATSVMSTVTTVIATVIAMFLLDYRLALVALALMPLFVLMTRRVGAARRRIATVRQESMADIASLVQESLSVSGILLGKTMGRSAELAQRFEQESNRLAGLEVKSRMTGRWMMQSIQMTFAIMPAAIYWFGGLADARGWGSITIGTLVVVHHASDPALCTDRQPAQHLGSTSRARSRSSTASSSTSTSTSTSRRGPASSRTFTATSGSTMSGSGTGRRPGRSPASTSRSRPGRRPQSSARPAPARRRSATWSRGSTT